MVIFSWCGVTLGGLGRIASAPPGRGAARTFGAGPHVQGCQLTASIVNNYHQFSRNYAGLSALASQATGISSV
jgi:hypothetical protein